MVTKAGAEESLCLRRRAGTPAGQPARRRRYKLRSIAGTGGVSHIVRNWSIIDVCEGD
jgi:hypothetical protein